MSTDWITPSAKVRRTRFPTFALRTAATSARIPAAVARRVHSQGHQWDRAKTHLLLLELSSNEALGHEFGEGVYQFWITPGDLRTRRFDKVVLTADAY
jgi:uncharacterized protein YwqG